MEEFPPLEPNIQDGTSYAHAHALARRIDMTFYPVTVLVAAVLLGLMGARSAPVLVGVLAALVAAVVALKLLTGRERPDGSSGDSFPSGHAAVAAYLAASLCLALGAAASGGRAPLPLPAALAAAAAAASGVWAAGVCWSRVGLRRHYASDVAAGAALGASAALIAFRAASGGPGG